MACSDNVVRAGLTPKFKHVDALVEMLTYKCGAAEVLHGSSPTTCHQQRLFQVPIPEFEVSIFNFDPSAGQTELSISASSGPSIVLVTQGSVKLSNTSTGSNESLVLSTGSSAFVIANTKLSVGAADVSGPITIFRATTNNSMFT
jgi:mannose-6-phosphate isomerase